MLLHYHDPAGWPVIREALLEMDKGHLIGNGPDCLVPPEGRGAANAPVASRNGGKAGNGKPVGSQLQKSSGNGKPAAQGASQGKPAGKPAHKGKTPTCAGSAKTEAKPATQGSKAAAKGNGTKRPARFGEFVN